MSASTSSSANPFPVDEWKKIVERVLASWSGYQLAVEHQSGGPDTKEKNEWFVDVLASHVHETKKLSEDNLEEWLEALLYTDFDLVLEDDSVYPTAHFLVQAYEFLKSGNRTRLEQHLATLPPVELVQQATKNAVKDGDSDVDDEGSDMEEEEDEDGDASKKERQPRTVTDDDGWTTVVPRK